MAVRALIVALFAGVGVWGCLAFTDLSGLSSSSGGTGSPNSSSSSSGGDGSSSSGSADGSSSGSSGSSGTDASSGSSTGDSGPSAGPVDTGPCNGFTSGGGGAGGVCQKNRTYTCDKGAFTVDCLCPTGVCTCAKDFVKYREVNVACGCSLTAGVPEAAVTACGIK